MPLNTITRRPEAVAQVSRGRLLAAMVAIVTAGLLSGAGAADWVTPDSPKLMGMYIGGPSHYDDATYQKQLSRFDVLVLNFWPKWKEYKYGSTATHDVLQAIKANNPDIHIGQYTNLNEAKSTDNSDTVNIDVAQKLDRANWWLRNADGQRAQWTDQYRNFDINITAWTKPDRLQMRYPQWLAERNYQVYYRPNPELDFWYLDNSLSAPAVKLADWKGDGKNEDRLDPTIAQAYRLGHVSYWKTIRDLQPGTILIGNVNDTSSPEYRGQLNGAFLEALIGKSWSTETLHGWPAMMARYHATMTQVAAPGIVGFGIFGEADDYQRLRYGLTSCLLDDGYFSYSSNKLSYDSVIWFDEYDLDIGKPVEPPSTKPWKNGVFRREFEKGLVLLNPGRLPAIVELEPGYRKFKGRQDPTVNNGDVVGVLHLGGKDGIILLKAHGQ